jgi:hypothetical protein
MTADLVGEGLASLAKSILDEASGASVGLDLRLDAFKAVTAYYVGVKKVGGKANDDDGDTEGGPILDRFRKRITIASGGG